MYHIGYVPAKLHTGSFGDCEREAERVNQLLIDFVAAAG
jgi:hypothetical protein